MSLVSYDWGSSDEESEDEEQQTKTTSIETSKLEEKSVALESSSKEKCSHGQTVSSSSAESDSDLLKVTVETKIGKPTDSKEEFVLPDFLEKGLKSVENYSEPLPLPAEFASTEENEEEILEIEDVPFDPSVLLAESKSKKRKITETTSIDQEKPKSIGSLFSSLNPPWKLQSDIKTNRKKQNSKESLKISIPSAPEPEGTSDDEDDSPAKKLKPSESGSGLSSLLPKPKHSISFTKADNPNKPFTKQKARPLIPHTLSKKKVEENPAVKKALDDEEDEPVSFFNFVEKPSQKDLNEIADHVSTTKPNLLNYSEMPSTSSYDLTIATPAENTAYEYTSHDILSTDRISNKPSSYLQAGSMDHYGTDDQEATTTYYYNTPYTGQPLDEPTTRNDSSTRALADDIDMEQILKLQGRRGQREEVNFMEFNCDEHLAPSNEWLKQVSEERAQFSAKKKDGNLPSSQTKKKHQITYLAFQAKERELELRNQWAQNRSAQRSSQSKYGF